MRQVDIIRPSSINAINGPIGTLKRILRNRDFFVSKGYDVTLFVNESVNQGPYKDIPLQQNQSGSAKSLGQRLGITYWLRSMARNKHWAAVLIHYKGMKAIERLVDYYLSFDREPDIVQFHSSAECFHYLKKRKVKKAKTVLFLHTDGIPFKMELESLPALEGTAYYERQKENFKWTIEHVDRIVFIARIGQKNFLQYFQNRSLEDTSVIINGLDDLNEEQRQIVSSIKGVFQESEFKYRLCCAGTISYRKGQRIVIEALQQLPSDLLKITHVDFIGDGAERIDLEQYVRDNDLSDHVRFLGSIPNTEVYKRLAENNIYILMSKNEGLPISIIEAMRVGLPTISTSVSGIPELVEEGYNGFLLNPDVDELTALLRKLPDYDWRQMGKNSRIRFEKEFTFERMEEEFCNMYDKTIKLYK